MIKLGITGSIGMGKTTVAGLFRAEGIPVFCSDDAVHALLAPGGDAEAEVLEAFPKAKNAQGIDRRKLGQIVFSDEVAMEVLEGILHPRVVQQQARFFARQRRNASGIVGFDIPLLFETGAENRLDAVVVASAPAWLQETRVMARPGMTDRKFRAIVDRQMPDADKRRRADFVVYTGRGMAASKRQVLGVIEAIRK